MSDANKSADAADPKKDAAVPTAADVKKGDAVVLVSARAGKVAAKAAGTARKTKDGRLLLDLEYADGDATAKITSAPHDPAGTAPDSWHLPAAE